VTLLFTAPSWLRQDEARIQKVTKRLHTLEEVNNNVKLLHEMLLHYSQEYSSDADKELMKVSCCELSSLLRPLRPSGVLSGRGHACFLWACSLQPVSEGQCLFYTADTPGAVLSVTQIQYPDNVLHAHAFKLWGHLPLVLTL
jgi:hypothetical protein